MANDRDLVSDPIYDTEDGQFDDVDKEELNGNTCIMLMLRRNCFAPKTNEAIQRTTLFSSMCIVKGKICHFVIDSGCSANVLSKEAVCKLALTPENHPHPYRLSWMQVGADVSISERTLLTFSIGSFYKDTLYCDIVPMDVSHIILSRPWQYEWEVIHNGKLNTNSFMFQGCKITFLTSPDADQTLSNDKHRHDSKQSLLIISR